MRTVSNVMGVVFILIGLIGFANHDMMGMHLSPTHNIIHLLTGALSLYFGIKGTERGVRNWCRTIGIVYGLLGVVGMLVGSGAFTLKDFAGQTDSHLLKVIPGHLEMGSGDSMMHIVLGLIFVVAGFLPRRVERRVDEASERAGEKVGLGR